MNLVIGLLVPFLGTSLGAACVFFMKNGLNRLVRKICIFTGSNRIYIWNPVFTADGQNHSASSYE